MPKRRRGPRGDYHIDRSLNIDSGGIEEWEDPNIEYYRFEATPYRALDELLAHYESPEHPFLVDYGSGLGRINIYLYHKKKIPGYGIELHEGRIHTARKNLLNYQSAFGDGKAIPVYFEQARAEYHVIDPRANVFYFFNPFSDQIYYDVLGQILASLEQADRPVDIIFYYPSTLYIMLMESEPAFKYHQLLTLDYSSDPRDCFMVYRHIPK